MRYQYYLVRIFEIFITLSASYLAVQSFFSSSIYELIKILLQEPFKRLNITVITSLVDINKILSLLISIIVFIVTIYYWILGKKENVAKIYHFNLLLFLPEILSFSSIKWLSIVDIHLEFLTERSFTEALLTGLVIMVGYVTHLFILNSRQTMLELESRGARRENMDKVFVKQSIISIILILTSFIIIMTLASLVSILKTPIHQLLSSYGYKYITLGLLSSIIISVSLLLYFRD